MTADQVQSALEGAGALATVLATVGLRWLSRAGRTIRRQRALLDDLGQTLAETRVFAIDHGHGVVRADLPKTITEKRAAALRVADPLGSGDDDEADD